MAALVDGASEPEELINADRDIIRYYDRLGDGVWDIFNAGLGCMSVAVGCAVATFNSILEKVIYL
jgi:hypothetical protein